MPARGGYEGVVHGVQRHHVRTPARAMTVDAARRQIGAPAGLSDARLGDIDAVLSRHCQRQCFGVQQVVPARAEGCRARRRELHQQRVAIGIAGQKLGLLATGRTAGAAQRGGGFSQGVPIRCAGSGGCVCRRRKCRRRRSLTQLQGAGCVGHVQGCEQRLLQCPVFRVGGQAPGSERACAQPADKALSAQRRQEPRQPALHQLVGALGLHMHALAVQKAQAAPFSDLAVFAYGQQPLLRRQAQDGVRQRIPCAPAGTQHQQFAGQRCQQPRHRGLASAEGGLQARRISHATPRHATPRLARAASNCVQRSASGRSMNG